MAHFQERRAGGDRRQYKGEDRRKNLDRRNAAGGDLEFIERARFKAWMSMTDRSSEK
jgi:hypothetical protein